MVIILQFNQPFVRPLGPTSKLNGVVKTFYFIFFGSSSTLGLFFFFLQMFPVIVFMLLMFLLMLLVFPAPMNFVDALVLAL